MWPSIEEDGELNIDGFARVLCKLIGRLNVWGYCLAMLLVMST